MTDCGVCGAPLVYAADSVMRTCDFCGEEQTTMIYCPAGHFVCDTCHGMAAMDAVRRVLSTTASCDPAAVLEQVMAHPGLPMHGPEHHAIVPGVIITAARNAGVAVPEGALDTALQRAAKVPGGWCGYYGTCGAAVGVGIAVSVLTGATPLKGEQRSLALAATSQALARMIDEQPRCCKRASRIAVEVAVEYLREHLAIDLPAGDRVHCAYSARNAQCARHRCPFFNTHSERHLPIS
jgi:7,8-dihydro-6-hydroxymethylpterin dimethyltransferase